MIGTAVVFGEPVHLDLAVGAESGA